MRERVVELVGERGVGRHLLRPLVHDGITVRFAASATADGREPHRYGQLVDGSGVVLVGDEVAADDEELRRGGGAMPRATALTADACPRTRRTRSTCP